MIRLIASDLDGTLLLNHAQSLTPGVIKQIRQLQEQKILFAAASGRQYQNLRRLFAPVADDIAYICENGSLIYYQNQILHQSTIPRDIGLEILGMIQAMDGCEALLSCAKTHYFEPKTPAFSYRMHYIVRNRICEVADLTQVKDPFLKISVYEPGGYRKETENRFRELFDEHVQIVTSGNDWLDMMPRNTHKGTAICHLTEALAIPLSNTAAIGDNLNDLEMLSCVGYPVCVQSANPHVKQICPVHVATVEDYLAQFI